jgi:hypothetical protein
MRRGSILAGDQILNKFALLRRFARFGLPLRSANNVILCRQRTHWHLCCNYPVSQERRILCISPTQELSHMNKFVALAAIAVSSLTSVACAADVNTPGETIQPASANRAALAETSVEDAFKARPQTLHERIISSEIEQRIKAVYVERVGNVVGVPSKTMDLEGAEGGLSGASRSPRAPQEFVGGSTLTTNRVNSEAEISRQGIDDLVKRKIVNEITGPNPR